MSASEQPSDSAPLRATEAYIRDIEKPCEVGNWGSRVMLLGGRQGYSSGMERFVGGASEAAHSTVNCEVICRHEAHKAKRTVLCCRGVKGTTLPRLCLVMLMAGADQEGVLFS